MNFLYESDIITTPIDETSLETIYEAKTIVNSVMSEANNILNLIDNQLTNHLK